MVVLDAEHSEILGFSWKRMCFYSLSNSIYLNTRGPMFSMAGDFIQVRDQNLSDLSKKVV